VDKFRLEDLWTMFFFFLAMLVS